MVLMSCVMSCYIGKEKLYLGLFGWQTGCWVGVERQKKCHGSSNETDHL